METINFAGLRRMLDYQVTFVIQHCTISGIMSDYADPQFCLNATELPPLLVPPPPKVLAVKGQTVKVTATYKGDYSKHFLQAFWIVKNPNSEDSMYILPGDNVSGYDVAVKNCNNCCHFNTSIIVESVALDQSGVQLESAGARSGDLTKYTQGFSRISVLNTPIIVAFSGRECQNLTTGHATTFTCTYNASSDPTITITKWSIDGVVIMHNTSHYTMTTEYGINELDQVRSTLNISNVATGNSGKYACWCEYNESLIYAKKVFRSNTESMCLKVHAGSTSQPIKIWEIVVGGGGGGGIVIMLLLVITCYCCYYYCKHKRKNKSSDVAFDDKKVPLLGDDSSAKEDSKHLQDITTVEFKDNGGTEPTRNEVVNSDTAATTVQLSQPNLKYLSTTGPIDSEKEAPCPAKPALTTHTNQQTTVVIESLPGEEFDTINKVLNQIAAEFTKSINVEALLPQLMKHQLLTYDQAYLCQAQFTPPIQKSQKLLNYLRHKGDEVLRKLLCCLTLETTHLGHTDVAAILKDTMKLYKLDIKLTCSLCMMDAISAKGTTSKILNHINPEFTVLINLDILSPILLKHHLLTDDETFICQAPFFPQGQKAQCLLLYLQRKGDKALHKLLCCLNMETTHLGHKDLAAKLKDAMELHNFEDEMVCSACKPSEESSAYHQPDVLEDVFDFISTNYPVEQWEVLASKLAFSEHDVKQMRSLADNTQPVAMVLQQWRRLNSQATREDFVAILRNANLDSVLQLPGV
ncbi:uncharacterized protein [Dysidea avara]|uniref:uncharacterized protein isoform X3 n=1 Tax=Dysidea avara TaxID=196820 RepID=UPI0033327CE8